MLLRIKLWYSHMNLTAEQLKLYLNRCVLPCLQLLHLETNVFEHLRSRYVGIWCGHLSVINSRSCFKCWPHGTCGASLWWSAWNGGYLDYAATVAMTHDLNISQSYLDLFHKFLLWWHFELFLLKSLPAGISSWNSCSTRLLLDIGFLFVFISACGHKLTGRKINGAWLSKTAQTWSHNITIWSQI